MTEEQPDRVECINCGETVTEDAAVHGAGSITSDGVEKLFEGCEPTPVEEVFEFNDGPYCTLDCSLDEKQEG